MFWFQQIKLLTILLLFDDCIILILLRMSLLTLMPINCSLLCVIVDGHVCHTALHFGVKAKENLDRVPALHWLPKLHKNPIKQDLLLILVLVRQ